MKRDAIISTPGANSAINTPATVSDKAIIPKVTVNGGAAEVTIKGRAVQSTSITVDYDVLPTGLLREYEDAYTERTINLYGERVQGIFGCDILILPKVTLNEAAIVIDNSAVAFKRVISQDETPVLEELPEELERATFKTPREIMLEYMCKAIFIAMNYIMFNKDFPNFSQHYTWFNTVLSKNYYNNS